MCSVRNAVKEWRGCHLAGSGVNEGRDTDCSADQTGSGSLLCLILPSYSTVNSPCDLHGSVYLVCCNCRIFIFTFIESLNLEFCEDLLVFRVKRPLLYIFHCAHHPHV